MQDLSGEIRDLRSRLRLQMLAMIGTVMISLFALGGADVVARALVEADSWKVRTNNSGSVLTDRIVVTTGVDSARVKITAANIELAQQPTTQLPAGAAPGAIAYDSTTNTLKYHNATNWVESVVGSGGGVTIPGLMQGRISISSSTTLNLLEYSGDLVEVGGEMVSIGATGKSLTTSTFLIDVNGNNTAVGMTAGNTYCVYLSNSLATGAPRSIRAIASITGTQPVSNNGTKYLGTTGNAANWRFIGYVRTDASTHFQDSDIQRFVVNYYNRIQKRLFLCPGYNNATTDTIWAIPTTWTRWNASASPMVEFLSNGEDQVEVGALACIYATGGYRQHVGIGVDSPTNVDFKGTGGEEGVAQSTFGAVRVGCRYNLTVGYHYFNAFAGSQGVGNLFLSYASESFTQSPYGSILFGTVMC